MTATQANASQSARPNPNFGRKVSELIRGWTNPVDLFAGAKLDDLLLVQNVVVFKRTSAKMFQPHGVTHNYHHRFELVIPLCRAGRIHVDGIGYTLAPGQALLIFPHQFHHYLDVENDGLSWLFITFELARPQLVLPLRNSPRMINAREGEFLRLLMADYLTQAPGTGRNFVLIMRVSELVQRLLTAREADCAMRKDRKNSDPRGAILQSINAHVRANLDKPLTLADLGKHTGYSISHLRAVFRQEFGVSLGGYMRESRLSIAAAMLTSKNRDSIEGIAKACGFVSIFAFSRAFKKATGLSPSAYSKLLLGGSKPRNPDGLRRQ